MSDYSIAIKIGAQLEKDFSASIRAAQSGLAGLGGTSAQSMSSTGKMAAAASKSMIAAGAMAAVAAKGAVIAGQKIVEVGKYSTQVGKDFESAMSSASATASATAEEYDKMKQAAMEMGKTTSKTATESAQALEYMALAGWDVDTSVSALPSVLKMSEASGMDLAQTSDLVTDSMAALGVTVDELPGYLDVAAKAQTKSNQSAEQLMQAYLGVGGTMKNLNVPIEESATALGVLANRGIKGSEAGNALNAIMVNLTTGTGQAGKMMQELGVSAFDSQGNFIGLEATLQQLNTALAGCSEEERNAAMAAIGGKQHVDALNDLMAGLNTTNEEGVSEWAALTSELQNCNGSLDAMRDTKLDNLEGDLAALESATQDVGIKIYEHMNGPMREFAQFGTQAVYQVSDALESGGLTGMAGAIGGVISDGLAMIVSKAPDFLSMGLEMLYSFEQGLGKNASGIAQSLMSLIGTAISTVIKNLPRHLITLGSIAVGLVKGVMISIGNGIKQAVPQILTLVPILFAKLLGAVIHAAPKLISAIPGVIKMAFGAVLKLNPVSIGIGIMKAVIKGIISMGKNVLGAFKDAIFGGGDNKADAEKAGAEAAQGYAAGMDGDVGASAETASALSQATDEANAAKGAPPAGGIASDTGGIAGQQAADTSGMAADTAAAEEAGSTDRGALQNGAGQTVTGTALEAVQPPGEMANAGADVPGLSDVMPALQIDADLGMKPAETTEAGVQPEMDGLTGGAAKTQLIPDAEAKAAKAPVDTAGITIENMPSNTDITGMGGGIPMPAVDAIQEIEPEIPAETMDTVPTEIPAEAVPADTAQTFAATATDILPETIQPVENESMADALPGAIQPAESVDNIPPEAIQPAETVTDTTDTLGVSQRAIGAAELPPGSMSEATVDNTLGMPGTSETGAMPIDTPETGLLDSPLQETPPEAAQTEDTQMPPVGIDMANVSNSIAQARDTIRTGIADSLAGQAIDASEMNVDSAALSDKMGIVGALGGQSLMAGIGQNIGGIVDASQVGIDTAGITEEETVQAAQLPPQDTAQPLPPTMADTGISPSVGEAAQMPVDSYAQVSQTGAEPQAVQKEDPQKTGISQILPMLGGFLKTVSAIGSANIFRAGMAFDMDALSSKMQSSTQAIPTQPAQDLKNTPWEFPKPDTPNRGGIIGETIDSLSKKGQNQEASTSESSPQIIYNPIFNIEGSGDVKEDVEKANRMGMREFKELMEQYLKENKRTKFA